MTQARFGGFDHIDTRIKCLSDDEAFYDRLMPQLGLGRKRRARVDARGDWHYVADGESHNTVEYYEPDRPGEEASFIGFIEDKAMQPNDTRIAFRIKDVSALPAWADLLNSMGAQEVEMSEDLSAYAAIFFTSPSGAKFEIRARP